MFYNRLIGIILSFFVVQVICRPYAFTITGDHYDDLFSSIDAQLQDKKLPITGIDYCPQEALAPEEFSYLVGVQPGSLLSAQELKKALFYLWKKGKFSAITARIEQSETGYLLMFECVRCYIVHAVKIHGGFLVGRDRYRNLYVMDSGDPFDLQKHAHSVLNIRHELYKEGFFNALIKERLDYDDTAKQVTVHLTPERGKQFVIGAIDLEILTDKQYATITQSMNHEIRAAFLDALAGALLSKDRLNATAAALKKSLVNQGWLQASIKLTQTIRRDVEKVDLCFTIDLHQKKEFVFVGNAHLSNEHLLEQLSHFGGSHLVPSSILCEEIQACYHKAGFLRAQVTVEDTNERLYFSIQEGLRAQIAQVSCVGLIHFDHQHLLKKSGALALEGKYFDQANLNAVLNKIADLYRQQGFWQAKIDGHECRPTQRDGWYDLVITVSPGAQSPIESVSITMPDGRQVSAPDFWPSAQLLTPENLALQRRRLHEHYPDFLFQPEITHGAAGARIAWHAFSEQSTHFGKTVITGSSKLPFDYIMRELRYKTGDKWDPLKVRRSMVALKELDIFDSISIYPYQQAVPFDERPMILKIIPDDPFEVRARTGMGFEYAGKELTYKGITYKVGGAMVFKNPFNYADYFFANADFTRTHRIAEAGYWRPWLFGYPVQTLVQLYNNAFQYPGIIGTQRNLYKVRQAGGLLGLVNKWDMVQAGVNVGFECMETTISNKRPQEGLFNRLIARAINFEPALLDKWVPYFLLEPTCFINTVDNQLYPTCGLITLCSIKGMIPVGSLDKTFFIKLMAEQSVFVPLWPTVLALRLRFGHILYQQFNNIMPSERFYLGGANSIRSYQTDLCPPLGVVPGPNGTKSFVPQGGKSMLNGNVEIRFPVYKQLWAAVFQDFGFLHGGNNLADLIKADLLAGSGFGLRYNTPIGPLRFDIGFKWKKPDKALPSFAWFLTLGQPF